MKPTSLIVGAVESTAVTLNALVRHGFEVLGVLGYEPQDTSNVSGWCDLREIATKNGFMFRPFTKINSPDLLDWAESLQPDLIFAVGFSQLLNQRWLDLPRLGCIGFHPTLLPRSRGRAPLAWIVLEDRMGAATYFLMGDGADDGPIFVQEPFFLNPDDDAFSTNKKCLDAATRALDRWLPDLMQGKWNPSPQTEAEATYRGVRRPEDGLIDWNISAIQIDRLIKATTAPHPGAYTYVDRKPIRIFNSAVETDLKISGVVGRILMKRESRFLVQCGTGLLWIDKIQPEPQLKVGQKLGMSPEDEIAELWSQFAKLESRLKE